MRSKLSPEQYRVLRQKGTEPPFSGKLLTNHRPGSYCCAACGRLVFTSETKYDDSSGWPSFSKPATAEVVILRSDNSFNLQRTEVCCANCGSHLGHLFKESPSQDHYCINSVALGFINNSTGEITY